MEWILLLAVLIVIAALIIKNGSSDTIEKEPPLYEQQPAFLSPAERSFYGVLLQVVDSNTVVFSKVRVADVLKTIRGLEPSKRATAFNKISAKHFDFVLCDAKTLKVKMVVELDDSSHQKKARVIRDEFLDSACRSAKLALMHIKAQRAYRIEEVRFQLFGITAADSAPEATVVGQLKPGTTDETSVFDLDMTPEGFDKVSSELKEAHRRTPQIYIHVGVEGNLKNQVLRIGRAKNGTYNRWMQSGNGHKNTFFWSIGESDSYTQKNAADYPNYLLFFASLFNQSTKLYVIDVNQDDMAAKETELIREYKPIWEQYRDTLRYSNKYPTLTGKNRNQAIVDAVAKLGAARRLIFAQRKLSDDSAKKLPDVVNLGLRSGKEWG
jgi:hypothetical protein